MTHPGKPDPGAPLSPLKQAFLAMQAAQARVQELERKYSEPIAIIGIGCRIPGAGEGAEGYWKLLAEGRVAVREGVEKRFEEVGRPTRLPESALRAGLLDQIDAFDPQHFGISPREAAGIDPQQRLLLETSWQALEDAGIDPFSLYKSSTGVFVGISAHDYSQLQLQDSGRSTLDPHFASGIASSVASGRLAYVLGLQRTRGFSGYRLLFLSRRRASGLLRDSQRRVLHRVGRRSQPDLGSRVFDRFR